MKIIKLKTILNEIIQEIDWNRPDITDISPGGNSKTRTVSVDDFVKMMNDMLEQQETREKLIPNNPRLTSKTVKNIVVKTDMGEQTVDVEGFIALLTTPPKTIFDIGNKSEHTKSDTEQTINTGIPALRGIIWDEEAKDFKIINTCPSAGACAMNCYALAGYYIINDGKNLKLARRLQKMIAEPEKYEKQAYAEAVGYAAKAEAEGKRLVIRWNDAGDFFGDRYFNLAKNLTEKLRKDGYDVRSYFFTKVRKYVSRGKFEGFRVVFSLGGVEKNEPDWAVSITVPRNIYKNHLIPKTGKHFEIDEKTGKSKIIPGQELELKKTVIEYFIKLVSREEIVVDPHDPFKVTVENTLFTDELPSKVENVAKYNAIVLPAGDSDSPAQRDDVRYIFLLEH